MGWAALKAAQGNGLALPHVGSGVFPAAPALTLFLTASPAAGQSVLSVSCGVATSHVVKPGK